MSALNDLIGRIQDEDLRNRIQEEVNRLNKQKKFGLVFEEHLPECTILYEIPVKKGANVTLRGNKAIEEIFTVKSITSDIALCESLNELHQTKEIPVKDLVVVAQFGEPIYPYLKPIDSICNAPDSDLWHTLIEADNYHALQLLEYLYAGKVDCIYIDPPYNTGARDWKYNNDYVDGSDSYRHSKWLSMMEKRLKLAKKLLNPDNSVLIVTIDEKEYLHLGCLLEELFPANTIQMVSSVINPKGNRRDNEFSRCEEYIFFVSFGSASISSNGTDMLRDKSSGDKAEDKSIRLRALLRGASNHGRRKDRPNLFYPLLFEKSSGKFLGPGPVLPINVNRNTYQPQDDVVAMWPIALNGEELTWNLQPETLMEKHRQHFLSFSKWDGEKRVGYYLSSGQEENFKNGLYNVIGLDDDGAYNLELKAAQANEVRPLTIWHKKTHSASEYGTTFLNKIIGSGRFSFPKSVYAVKDTIRFYVANDKNALILDFFAGSGTTLHAVNLLNAEDGGHRRCIMVTNNELSEEETKRLLSDGYKPGDAEWDNLGIARYVTWPRTTCSIKGIDIHGEPLKGDYLTTGDEPMPMANGFKTNAVFYKLAFLNKTSVALGRQFKELIPILWMKAGAVNECPSLSEGESIPNMLIFPKNKFAVLVNEKELQVFKIELVKYPQIETVYIVTDSEDGYQEIASELNVKATYQLYRDYLDNFKINNYR